MTGRWYTVFDTSVGRCGIAWGPHGIVGVQLPAEREIETRRRLLRKSPEAREVSPTAEACVAIDGIVALLRGQPADFADVTLDIREVSPFARRVYDYVRTILRGETMTYNEVADRLKPPGAPHAVAQALSQNPFPLIVPCHRVLEAGGYADRMSVNSGSISKRRLLSIDGAGGKSSQTLFDVLLPVARPPFQG
ncbi:MAG: methylated-DNA--[protein]-cysteine S-methyltransferase [Proteobacteria bacterium]|nr:methylated-DNA--[protein]-cysteine S-methyltransferase [Pseudomonadota bacterium]